MTSMSDALKLPTTFRSQGDVGSTSGHELVGKVVGGKYYIQKILGSGGMGVLYLAKHKFLERFYAIKVIRISGNPLTSPNVRRFRREAQTLAKMTHRNIVEIIDYDYLPDHTPFYVMEYIEGMNMASFMRHHPLGLPVPLFALLMRQLGDAVGWMHKQDVIHRDLKPSNVMINLQQKSFGLKILDFGLVGTAAYLGERLTLSGEIMGTPAYMAPEQCTRDEVSKQSDIYSLALIAYEMLTGQPAVSANSVINAVRLQIHGTPISLKEHDPNMPDSLVEAIQKALSKDPEDRFESVADFVKAMRLPELIKQNQTSAIEYWPVRKRDDGQSSDFTSDTLASFHAGETRTVFTSLNKLKMTGVFVGGLVAGACLYGLGSLLF